MNSKINVFDVSIVIVNWNAAKYLEPCLKSIVETKKELSIELILVDASSTDNSCEIAKTYFKNARVIVIPENLGYVKGNNIGIKEAKGRYTLLLNSDTIVYENALQELVAFMDENNSVGVASSSILNPDGSDQGVVRRFPSIMNGIFGRRSFLSQLFPNNRWYKRYMQSRNMDSALPFETEIMSACAMFLRSSVAKEVSGFDERFKFYWVDAEYCIRLSRMGYGVFCVPKAKIMHYEGKGGSTSTLKKKLTMNKAFNDGAYLAFVEYHQFGILDPRRHFTWVILKLRTILLAMIQILRPNISTSSGGKN